MRELRPEPMGGGDGGDRNGRWMEMMTGATEEMNGRDTRGRQAVVGEAMAAGCWGSCGQQTAPWARVPRLGTEEEPEKM